MNDCNPEIECTAKLPCGEKSGGKQSATCLREAVIAREETSKCTGRPPRGRGPGDQGRCAGNNVGKSHLPAGIGDNLQRPGGIGIPEATGRDLAWRMGSYERERGGNSPRGGRSATTAWVTPTAVRRSPGTWRPRFLERVPDTDPGQPVHRAAWRVCCQSRNRRGVCEPTLELPGGDAGRWRKARPPNRTRENRPSGMTTEASGNVTLGGPNECWRASVRRVHCCVPVPGSAFHVRGPPVGARTRVLSKPP